MTHAEYEKLPTFPGLLIGGGAASVVGGVTLPMILSVSLASDRVVPVGVVGMAVVAATAGAIMLAVRCVRRDLAQHRADHQTATLTVEDVAHINTRLDSLDRRVGETHELLAHTSMCTAPPPAIEPANGERQAYANGAVDMLDGRTTVVPINGSMLQVVPVRDPRHHA